MMVSEVREVVLQGRKQAGLCVWCANPLSDRDKMRGKVTCELCRASLKRNRKAGRFTKLLAQVRDRCTQCNKVNHERGICQRCRVKNFANNHGVSKVEARELMDRDTCELCGEEGVQLTVWKGERAGMICRPCRWQVQLFERGEIGGMTPAMLMVIVRSTWLAK